MEINYKIYTLSDPDSKEIKYVGYTKNSLNKRLYQHLRDPKRGIKSHKASWINELDKNGKKPLMQLIEENLTMKEALEKEIFYIDFFKTKGYKLTNSTTGGDSYYEMTKEVKAKMSLNKKGKYLGKNNHRFIDLSGKRFGKLIAIEVCEIGKKTKWRCHCDCGNKNFITKASYLNNGRTKSCGCSYNGINSALAKPILQLEKNTGKILSAFECISDAIKFTNVSNWFISRFIEGVNMNGGGYDWKIIERVEHKLYGKYRNNSSYKYTSRIKKIIVIFSNGEEKIFKNMSEAERAIGIKRKTISNYIKSKKIHKSGIKFKQQ